MNGVKKELTFNLKVVPNNPSTPPRMLIYHIICVIFYSQRSIARNLALLRVPGEVGHVGGT